MRTRTILAALGALLAAGCGSQEVAEEADQALSAEDLRSCPLAEEGVRVEAEPTADGAAITFTTASGDVASLRQRVQLLAQRYGERPGRGPMGWGPPRGRGGGAGMGPGAGMGMGPGPLPEATATVEEVEQGARLELKPKDPAQLAALQERAQQHAARMTSGQCWMATP